MVIIKKKQPDTSFIGNRPVQRVMVEESTRHKWVNVRYNPLTGKYIAAFSLRADLPDWSGSVWCGLTVVYTRPKHKHVDYTQWAHDVYTTWPQHRCNVMTLHRR